MLDTVFLVAAAILGACVGSFLNVVIYRVPQGTFRRQRRSVCPACGAMIPWFLNLPLLSWTVLRGRARCCGAAIAFRYPMVEGLTALLFVALYLAPPTGPVTSGATIVWPGLSGCCLLAAFVAGLVACTFIDIDHRILPDVITKPGMVAGLLGSLVVPGLAGRLWIDGLWPPLDSLLYSALGLATGLLLTWSIRVAARAVFRKEAMGLGDVKFMGMIGAFIGYEGALLTFFLASLVGAVGGMVHRVITRDAYVPFGPFLAIGAVLALFFRGEILVFLFETWPEWQQTSPSAPWLLTGSALLCLFALVVLVRRGRGK